MWPGISRLNSPAAWSAAGTAGGSYGVTGLTHLKELLVTGPTNISGVGETESRQRIFTCRPSAPAEARPCAQSILSRLATRAHRRPPSSDDIADLMRFYDAAAAQEGFEAGVQMGLQAILVSPEFVFRLEREPDPHLAHHVEL